MAEDEAVAVLVVDDQEVFRSVMRDVVDATAGMTLAGEATSGEEAVELARTLAPQLVLMDKRMPGIGGLEAARRIRERHPEIVVVLASVEAPNQEALDRSRAHAFLDKRRLSPRTLAEAWSAPRV